MAVDLPPPSYWFLVGLTLLAYPFVLRAADAGARRVVRHVLLSFVVLELALVLLFYSRLVCWLLAGAASVSVLLAAPRRPEWGLVAFQVALALAAGLAFQFSGDRGFVVYFLVGLPLLFGLPLAHLVLPWLRYDAAASSRLATLGVVLFAAWIGVSAFGYDFLVSFEVLHLPVTAIALGSLALLSGPGWRRSRDCQRSARGIADADAYLARPMPGVGDVYVGLVVAVVAMAAFLALRVGDVPLLPLWALGPPLFAFGGVLMVSRLGGHTAWARQTGLLLVAIGFVGPLLVMGEPVVQSFFLQDTGDWRIPLALGGIAATAGLYVLAVTWSLVRELSGRAAVAEARVLLPPDVVRETATTTPDVPMLRRFARSVAAADAFAGVLVVPAPRDPLWTLPDDVHDWLVSQRNPDVRVHVAIEAPEGVYTIPEVWPEEHDA